MSNVEYFGRVHQKPPKVNANDHPYFTGKREIKPVERKKEPEILEEVRIRDEDLPPDEY